MNVKIGWMEKRMFERVSASLRVTYRRVPKAELVEMLSNPAYRESTTDHLPELAKTSSVLHAVTQDLSVGGMSLSGSEEFPLGDAVAVYLYLPDTPTPVTIVAEVVRSDRVGGSGDGAFRAGLKILAVNREDVVRIEKYLLTQKLKDADGAKHPKKG